MEKVNSYLLIRERLERTKFYNGGIKSLVLDMLHVRYLSDCQG